MQEIKLIGLNETIYEHVTKEGLHVYMWKNEKVKSTLISLSVKYGSIDTKFKVNDKTYEVPNGIAHFLEHVKFNMKNGITAHDEFLKIGGDANAFTTFDYTSYLVFATQNIDLNLNTLLDFVYTPYFTNKLINKEKGIIVEEANMGMDDAYQDSFYHHLQNVFKKSKYKNYITGTIEEIKNINMEDIRIVYDTFYHPKNMFMCITGNFNPYEMAQIIDKNLSKKKFNKYKEPVVIHENEPVKVNKENDLYYNSLTYPRIKLSIKVPLKSLKKLDKFDIRMYANAILAINFGSTSIFKEELISNELITALYPNVDIFGDYLLYNLTITTKYPDEVIKRVKKKLRKLKVPAEDVKRKKNALIATLILDFDDIENVNNMINEDIIYNGFLINNVKERLENFSMNDLEYVLNNIDINNMSISIFMPKDS